MQNKTNINVKYVAISELKPADYNPRKWDESAINQLKESVNRFGLVDPIIANGAAERFNVVIGGHFRLKVAKDLGYTEIPVVYINIPDINKEKELNLRLNRNTGEWDLELLKSFDIDLLLKTGFDDNDLANIWDDALDAEDDGFDIEKELGKIKKPETKLGDIFQLGNHRLICGDSTDPEIVKKLVGKEQMSMIYCDPIYNIGFDYDKGLGIKPKYGGKTDDNKSDAEYKNFLKKTIENALAVAKKDCHVFYWCDERYIGLIQELYSELGIANKRVCLWIKGNQNPTPQIAFNKVYEPCVYGTRGNPYLSPILHNLNEIMNKETGTGNQLLDDIIDILNIWLVKRIPGSEYEHPTQKPPTLHEKALKRCAKSGDTVLDLFGGSGSTLIACEQLKRKAYLVEIEPIFCDLIINRYRKLTNDKIKKLN